MRCVLVHYHELALKGRNRPYFEQRLVRNLRLALRDMPALRVDALQGRIRIQLEPETPWLEIRGRLRRVFGVANFAPAHGVRFADDSARLLEPLKHAVGEAVRELSFQTFRVSTKRSDKRLPFTSMDVDREVGAHVQACTGKAVDLRHPDLTIFIETLHTDAYYSVSREPGPGGLPVGTAGHVACLLSGGIDSPVAAYRMMKRGCKATFIHFHGRPYVSRASEEKVRDLVETLTPHQSYSRLYLVPFGDIQRRIVLGAPAPLRVVLYRRMMVRIAEELARRGRCWCLVTGDSLGQVASQTPQNLSAVDDAATLPILRPLIGMDKVEITEEAQRIGTFQTSIEPDQDCCRLFIPPHPTTRAGIDQVRKVERGLDIDALTKEGVEQADLVEFEWPERRPRDDRSALT
jgi:thiamine biosynthesis protein ThiI